MSHAVLRHIPQPPPTREELDYADLAIIDLEKYKTPEGRAQLVVEVHNVMKTIGFFYVINHGYTQEQTTRMFDIAHIPFSEVTPEEKNKYVGQMKTTGSYQGYKPRGYWHIEGGISDVYSVHSVHRDVTRKEHPEALRPFIPEIAAFTKHNHFNVLHPLLRLVARSLELPEDTLVDLHNFDAEGESYLRMMKYYPRSEEEEQKTRGVWFKGHTGSTSPFQNFPPVSALQIKAPDGTWKWVKHIDNAIVVNTGEAMDFLTGLYYKGTIHQVVQPPSDQRHLARRSIVYFGFAHDDVKLVPLKESPVLQRVGIQRRCDDEVAPTMEAWRKGRISAYGQTALKEGQEKGVQEEVINGVLVKHYT
ncbi:hypothetical protein FPV67DRAFT_1667589 [Lyophyllum atratum]|nr:hypothetical protein FPV67DRAFT_1667589 [Lyophyllum atratum]